MSRFYASVMFTVLAIFVSSSLLAVSTNAASIGQSDKNHTIIEVQDLIETADAATWSNQRDDQLSLGVRDLQGGLVRSGIKKGGINGLLNRNGERYFDPSIESKTIDIELEPTMGRNDTEVRGSYVIEVPDMYNVQLESMYDIFVDEFGERGKANFWFEIYEQQSDSSWKLIDKVENPYPNSMSSLKRLQVDDEAFNTYNVILNLNDVRGKTVRLNLVSNTSKQIVSSQKGRWTRLKLIASSFKVALGEAKKNEDVTRDLKASLYTNTKQSWIESVGSAESITIPPAAGSDPDIFDYPDGALAITNWGTSKYGYTHLTYNPVPYGSSKAAGTAYLK